MNAQPTALVVVTHHRADSFTAHIADLVTARLKAAGYAIDLLDLQAEGFDPRMTVADQPDWGDRDKAYSEEVQRHERRLLAADVIIPVFPIYWFHLPALLKGWIDRVWNYGFAYGRSKPRLAGRKMLWIGLAGATADDPTAPMMQEGLDAALRDSISYYCGITEAAVEILFDAESQPQSIDENGLLHIGKAIEGEAFKAHFAKLENQAVESVEKFLALS
ncbi:NAD(P)H oxidoreductase [Glycomyces tarimensis]